MTEYCRKSQSLTIYYIGSHNCPLKLDTNKYSKQVRDAVLRNSGLDAHGIQQAVVGQVVANSDIREAQRRAMQLSYTNIKSEKAKVAHERNSDKHSLEAVGIPKQATDKEDKYLIYKINNLQFNEKPDYIFTNSAPMAQLAIDMDQDGPEHPLQGAGAYAMAVSPNVLNIKLLHYLFTIQPCGIYLDILL